MEVVDRRTRPNRAKETIVNAGIIMASVDGRAAAALFLEREGVHFSTIVRVLDDRGLRRPTSASGIPTSSTPAP